MFAPEDVLRTRRLVPMSEAARTLGITQSAMSRLARRRGLLTPGGREGGALRMVLAEPLDRLKEEARDFLLPSEARREMGLTDPQFGALVAAGLLRAAPLAGRVLETRPFRRDDLADLLRRCEGDTPPWSAARRPLGRRFMTLQRATALGLGFADVVRALADGRLRPSALLPGEAGLRRIRVDADAVVRLVCRTVPAPRAVGGSGNPDAEGEAVARPDLTLSVLDVAREIGVKHEAVYVWMRRGLLRVDDGAGGIERGRRISREALDEFRRLHITGRELRLAMGDMADHWNARMLSRIGVDPVSGPGVDRGKMALFRRDQVTPDVLARLRRFRTKDRPTRRESRHATAARLATAMDVVARTWGVRFARSNNTCREVGGDRVVYLLSGRRQTFTGPMYFFVRASVVEAMGSEPNAWFALVPRDSDVMLLVPAGSVPWILGDDKAHLIVPYDRLGNPQRFVEHAVRIAVPVREAA